MLFKCTNLNTVQRIVLVYNLYFIVFLYSKQFDSEGSVLHGKLGNFKWEQMKS